jgi:hypothetical protein
MAVIVFFIICGAILTFLMSTFPAVNAFVLKHTQKLIEAIGTLMAWSFWILIIYMVLVYFGFFERPIWM